MSFLNVTFTIPPALQQGLASNLYERVGGVIRDAKTKEIIAWLREAKEKDSPNFPLGLTTAPNVLNLGVAVMGFVLVLDRLNDLEQRIQQAQAILEEINIKLDLSFYAKFRAALTLADKASRMTMHQDTRAMFIEAIARLAEVRNIYIALTDLQLAQNSPVVNEHLWATALAAVAEARCYLELESLLPAQQTLAEGLASLRPRVQHYVTTLLTSNPAAYLHPSLKQTIDLRRLTQVFRWLSPELDEHAVFEAQRENLFNLAKNPEPWIESLPPAIGLPKEFFDDTYILGRRTWRSVKADVYNRLPQAMNLMEALIEDVCRLETYLSEVHTIQRLGMAFHEWRELQPPTDATADESGLIYIALSGSARLAA